MPHGNAAARTKRKVLAEPRVLDQQPWDVVGLDRRAGQRPAQRLTRDFLRGRHVPIQECRRNRQHIGNVVEPVLIGIVGGKQRADVDLDAEEIADGVGVLRAVQAMHRRTAGIHVRGGRAVEGRFQSGDKCERSRRIGPRPTRWRHRTGAQLPHNLFPRVGVGGNLRHVGGIEREARRLQPLVMARDAVSGEELGVCGLRRRALKGRRSGCSRRAGEQSDAAGDQDRP